MTDSKHVKIPMFKGEEEEFQKWFLRFKAYAKVKKFQDVLCEPKSGDYPASQDDFDAMAAGDATTIAFKSKLERNAEAIAQLTIALDSESLLNKVYEAEDDDWPEGMAWKIMKSLKDDFQPGDRISSVELKRKLNKVFMKKKDHPKVLFEKIAAIDNIYKANGKALDEEDAIAVVLDKCPKAYAHVLASQEGIYGDQLKLKHLREAMTRQYRIVYGTEKSSEDDDNGGELQLSAFNGTCYHCGEKGHKANNCPNKKQKSKTKFTGKCNFCGKVGHKEADCWDKPENADKRPKGWKTSEKGLTVKNDDADGNEFMLVNTDENIDDEHEEQVEYCLFDVASAFIQVDLDECKRDDNSSELIDEEESEDDSEGSGWIEIHFNDSNVNENEYDEYDEEYEWAVVNNEEENVDSWFYGYDGNANIDDVLDEEEGDEFGYDYGLMAFRDDSNLLNDPNIFIADTGATCDSTPHGEGLIDKSNAKGGDGIIDASGNVIKANSVGTLQGMVCDKEGQDVVRVSLKDVVHMPKAKFNLFSISKRLQDGWALGGNAKSLWLTKGNDTINFDIKISTAKGALYCMCLRREVAAVGVESISPNKGKAISINTAHQIFGHVDENSTRKMAKQLGYELSRGTLKACESCAIAKAKQKNIPKIIDHVSASEVNGRMHLDLSTVKPPEHQKDIKLTRRNWCMIIDEKTGMKFSSFHETKNGMVEPTCKRFKLWKQNGKPVKILRMDNAGENKLLETTANNENWQLNVTVEYTAAHTPQQNSICEVAIATIAKRGRALMIAAQVPYFERFKLWKPAFLTATLLDNLMVVSIDGKEQTRVEHWNGKLPNYASNLRTWGEAGVVKIPIEGSKKLADRGKTCMFVGYCPNHADGVYQMWSQDTNQVHETRDILWLKRMFLPHLSRMKSILMRTGLRKSMKIMIMVVHILIMRMTIRQMGMIMMIIPILYHPLEHLLFEE